MLKRPRSVIGMAYALLLSIGFWLLNALSGTYSSNVEIDIEYVNQRTDNQNVSNELPNTIKVDFKDEGRIILWNTFTHSFKAITIDLSTDLNYHSSDHQRAFISNKVLSSKLKSILPASSQMLSVEPSQIYLSFEEYEQKMVPIVLDYEIDGEVSNRNISLSLSQDSIQISGPKRLMEKIDYWKTEMFTIESKDINQSITLRLLSPDDQSFSLSENEINADIFQDQFQIKRLQKEVMIKNAPEGYEVNLMPSIVEIEYQIPLAKELEMNDSLIQLMVDFEDVDFDLDEDEVTIEVYRSPIFISHIKIKPVRVNYLLSEND